VRDDFALLLAQEKFFVPIKILFLQAVKNNNK